MTIDGTTALPRPARPPPLVSTSNPAESILPTLIAVAKSTRALLGIKLGDVGFHNGQDEFLLALDDGVLICVSDLSERLAVRPSTVSKMMDRLAERRLVERVADKEDSRRTMVRITPAGIAAKAIVQEVHDWVETDVTKDMSRAERAAMRDGLIAAQNCLATRLMRLR